MEESSSEDDVDDDDEEEEEDDTMAENDDDDDDEVVPPNWLLGRFKALDANDAKASKALASDRFMLLGLLLWLSTGEDEGIPLLVAGGLLWWIGDTPNKAWAASNRSMQGSIVVVEVAVVEGEEEVVDVIVKPAMTFHHNKNQNIFLLNFYSRVRYIISNE